MNTFTIIAGISSIIGLLLAIWGAKKITKIKQKIKMKNITGSKINITGKK